MSDNERKALRTIDEKLDNLINSVETVRRGVYGDPENNVMGLLQRQDIDEKERANIWQEIGKIKNVNWKYSVFFGLVASGVVWVVNVLIKML
jgi:hypothetical protein